MILKLPDLCDVGSHFHHLGDFSGLVFDGGGPGEDVELLTGFGCHDFFGLMPTAVYERRGHRTVCTPGEPVLVNLKAEFPDFMPEIPFKQAIGGGDSEIFILNRNIAGHFIKKLLKKGLGIFQLLDF
jgi:hypothetical protein